ncbi:MAG: anion permease, partial [Pseudomonadales bacterium]|nr:anion permease [Pseudomonadales bacterium]
MPELPDGHAIAAIVLTVSALWAYTRPNWSLELTSLGLLAVLAFAAAAFPHPNLHPQDYFAGFGNEALIAVCALMVLGQGLVRTGALEPVGRTLGRFWRKAPFLTFLLTLVVAATLSAFVNNTPIVVLLLPILVSVCLKADDSPARVLMPMNFATIVGGAITTIGTSTNLLVVGVAEKLGMERLGMFDFVLPASIAAGVAILYLWLIAPLLLPRRDIGLERQSPRVYEARLQLRPDSPACGKTLEQAIAMTNGEMKVVRVRREGTFILP